MKHAILAAAALCLLAALPSCGPEAPKATETTSSDYSLTLNFSVGPSNPDNPIYVSWIESADGDFVRYIYACERLDYQALAGKSGYDNIKNVNACPYWRTHLYQTPLEEDADVVSGPTVAEGAAFGDFAKSITIPALSPSRFTVYFEIDHSFDSNDWWNDQPAILYAADVDLSKGPAAKSFPLAARGWSRNGPNGGGNNMNKFEGNPGGEGDPSMTGVLQADMRYIADGANGSGTDFGPAYPAGSAKDATNMVGSISLAVARK
jgi:hypothetical protein